VKKKHAFLLSVALALFVSLGNIAAEHGTPWARHTIDDSSRGADGVRLADVNADGLMDIATPWEEGGCVRVYLNPGPSPTKRKWPAVTVGEVGSPEDAVFVDLDGDGGVDVVSCCEGDVKSIWVHWAPRHRKNYLQPILWKTQVVPVVQGTKSWMFCVPTKVDGRNGVDLVAGAKGRDAQIGWLESPKNPRDLAPWKWHPLCEAGWVMSLFAVDMDGDGDLDILASDRKGPNRGCFWLENPGDAAAQAGTWKRHPIGGEDKEVMFIVPADLDRDGFLDVVVSTAGRELLYCRRKSRDGLAWESFSIRLPETAGFGKGVGVGDIDLDGKPDIVFTCEGAKGKSGVMWLSRREAVTDRLWDAHEISGPEGSKFDLVELLDLDGDGDLDVLTCEEQENLGVLWYENPTRP